ncbi:HNH endonuclease signature motif containing protein [Microbacterium kyungheense]|uniref:Uncharacterized protein DUF222 n=1 Tax=Microbacterium kyungheense TaxID=1263636 RepID=A0A543EQC5_9MICO|nr:HNH endonuclease signature motif containing protein [Microbacterium kyungheense]TQM23785.1 uncharacterized protein DUF222 [Microbacterium kyungheense]
MGNQLGTGDAIRAALERVVSDVQATRVEIARLQAEEARLLTDAAGIVSAREDERRAAGRSAVHDLALREVSSELGAAMRLSDRTVQARMSAASTLVDGFAATHRALADGRIDHAHAGAIVDCGAGLLDEAVRAEYERILLEAAEFETPPRLRTIARVVAARIDPELAAELQRRAHGARRVRVIDLDDGMARLIADLPAVLAYAIFDRLTQMAAAQDETDRAVAESVGDAMDADAARAASDGSTTESPEVPGPLAPAAGERAPAESADPDGGGRAEVYTTPSAEQRSRDELRSDILVDLLLTGAPTAHGAGGALASIRAEVQITIPVLTAAGTGDEPALLTGYGPIDRETACALAAAAPGWDRVMYHPHTGLPLSVDRYRPSAELRRFLRARDERCRFPGCVRKPTRCDVDHTVDHARGGRTAADNLAHFCPRHHTVKHATAWHVRQVGRGVLEWTSLTGRRYLDRPPSVVQFVPSGRWAKFASTPYRGDAPF